MKQRQTNVDQTGSWEPIIKAEAQNKTQPHTHRLCSKGMLLVQAQQGYR